MLLNLPILELRLASIDKNLFLCYNLPRNQVLQKY